MTYGASTRNDLIVIAGMTVEAPGGVDSPSALWSALCESRELIPSMISCWRAENRSAMPVDFATAQ